MKKVLFAAFAGLSVMFIAASSGSVNSERNHPVSQVNSENNWNYNGDSTAPKPDSPKYAMNIIFIRYNEGHDSGSKVCCDDAKVILRHNKGHDSGSKICCDGSTDGFRYHQGFN